MASARMGGAWVEIRAAGRTWAWWRKDMLTTIGVGMAVYLVLKLGWGW
jgi:hypothetical protein